MNMGEKIAAYELQSIQLRRAIATADFNNQLKAIEITGKALCIVLIESVPDSLKQFMDDENVLGQLWNYGQYSTNIVYNRYNFEDYTAVKKAVDELAAVWTEQIQITLENDLEPDRVDIRFRAAYP
jgi:hypothetical protein